MIHFLGEHKISKNGAIDIQGQNESRQADRTLLISFFCALSWVVRPTVRMAACFGALAP